MDPNTTVLAPAAVVAAVKALRTSFPRIDGIAVLGAAVLLGTATSWLAGAPGEALRDVLARGAFWGFAASGFMAAADRLAGK